MVNHFNRQRRLIRNKIIIEVIHIIIFAPSINAIIENSYIEGMHKLYNILSGDLIMSQLFHSDSV